MNIFLFYIYLLLSFMSLGTLIKRFFFKSFNFSIAFISGFCGYFALFECIALPFMLIKGRFDILCNLFFLISLLILFIGLFIFIREKSYFLKNIRSIFEVQKKKANKCCLFLLSIFIILFLFQLIIVIFFAHFDADDSFYIAISNACISSNQIFGFEPSTGTASLTFPAAYSLTSYELLVAFWAKIFSIKPILLFHTLLPAVFISTSYLAFYLLGKKLFLCFRKSILFLIIIAILNLFSNYSVYLPGSFLLFRSWQGKSSLVTILLPTLLFFFIQYTTTKKNNQQNYYLFCCTLTLISAACFSSVGIYLLPVLYFCLVVGYFIQEKSCFVFFRMCLNAIPSAFLLAVFAFIVFTGSDYNTLSNTIETNSYLQEIKKYFGSNYLIILIYLLISFFYAFKDNKIKKLLFVYYPITLFLTFLNPILMPFVSRYLSSASVYWRLFWLLPFYATLASGLVDLFFIFKKNITIKLSLLIILSLIVLPKNYIFTSDNFVYTGNFEKIPADVIYFSEKVLSEINTPILLASPEYNTFIRQYTGDIEVLWTRNNYIEEAYLRSNKIKEYSDLESLYLSLLNNHFTLSSHLSDFKINSLILKTDSFNSFNPQYTYTQGLDGFTLLVKNN